MRKLFCIALISLYCLSATAQRSVVPGVYDHRRALRALLRLNHSRTAAKTTTGVLKQRVVAQSTWDNSLGSLSDSVELRYSGQRGAEYDYNTMIFPCNYTYSTSPLFDYAGIFTVPQVAFDTYVHWTMDPFTMPSFGLYEAWFATYDTNSNQTTFKELFVDSVTNDNRYYVNSFNTANKIDTGSWFNYHMGLADSALRQFFTYDTSGRLSADSLYELHLGIWRIVAATSYDYDDSGNLVQIDHFANETDTSFLLPLVQQSKYENTYDASNRMITVLTSLHNGTVLTPYVKDTFGYSGSLTWHDSWRQHQFDGIHLTWWPQYNMSKHISAGRPDTVYHKGWDSIAHSWVPIAMDVVTYNSYNNPDTMQNYLYNWSAYSFTPDYTTIYYYDTFTYVPPPSGVHAPLAVVAGSLVIFPNPAADKVVALLPDGHSGHSCRVTLVGADGRLIYTSAGLKADQIQVPIDRYPAGIYYMAVIDNETGQRFTASFVKE